MIRWLLFDEARYEEPGLTNPYANRPSYARFGTLLASTIWARSTVGVVMAVLGAASVKMNARFEQRSQGMADQELLLADLQHFSESLWRNEEVGEKRFNFFVTLVTAASAGLVTLYASQHAPTGTVLEQIRNGVLIALAGFGTLTYLRMLQRNRVTDEYKRTLTYIRKRLVAIDRSMRNYRAETVGAVNAIILCVLAFVMESPLPAYIPTIACIILCACFCNGEPAASIHTDDRCTGRGGHSVFLRSWCSGCRRAYVTRELPTSFRMNISAPALAPSYSIARGWFCRLSVRILRNRCGSFLRGDSAMAKSRRKRSFERSLRKPLSNGDPWRKWRNSRSLSCMNFRLATTASRLGADRSSIGSCFV